MIDTAILHARIADRAKEFVRELFGDAAKSAGTGWRVGKRGSLAISIKNDTIVYYDHEYGEGGDSIALAAREWNCTPGDALRCLAEWVGLVSVTIEARPTAKGKQPATKSEIKPAPGIIPAGVFNSWAEGGIHLWPGGRELNHDAIEHIANWRGWPVPFVETLVRCGAIAVPNYFGKRTAAAFMVCEPVPWLGRDYANRDRPRFVGWHGRLPGDSGWRYSPKGLRTMPMILADRDAMGQLWDKRLLIVCEGQWDALTIALAADWYDSKMGLLAIPPTVAIVGLRGAGSWNDWLGVYGPYLRSSLDIVVLRDRDKAGAKWIEPAGLIDALSTRFQRVVCAAFTQKDANDAYRAGKLNRAVLDAIFQRGGWTLAEIESEGANEPTR